MIKHFCNKGINQINYHYENKTIVNVANLSRDYRDVSFWGAFCPPNDGVFRLIFDGSLDLENEQNYSFYRFNNLQLKNRTTPFYALLSDTCYPYYFKQAVTYSYSNWGILYFEELNKEKQVMTSEFSVVCEELVCKQGSLHPQCLRYITCKHQTNKFHLYTCIFLLFN